tara:strand:+ start:61 stop:306 length:246 start_codon:yes stop_codon:yes gene_type:complete
MYKVESNIPIKHKKGRDGKTNFLRSLNVGESFVISKNDTNESASNWYIIAKRLKMKIVTRTINNSEIRIWVVEKDGKKIDD